MGYRSWIREHRLSMRDKSEKRTQTKECNIDQPRKAQAKPRMDNHTLRNHDEFSIQIYTG